MKGDTISIKVTDYLIRFSDPNLCFLCQQPIESKHIKTVHFFGYDVKEEHHFCDNCHSKVNENEIFPNYVVY